jgi:hypothetical protein
MDIILKRTTFTEHSTIGEMYVDGVFECYTLEDRTRAPGVKIPKETAIPYGRYQLVLDYSPKYKRIYPHILDVPMFTGIRIHPGNTDIDTEGCILLGRVKVLNKVLFSRMAFDSFLVKLSEALLIDKAAMITIISDPVDVYYHPQS